MPPRVTDPLAVGVGKDLIPLAACPSAFPVTPFLPSPVAEQGCCLLLAWRCLPAQHQPLPASHANKSCRRHRHVHGTPPKTHSPCASNALGELIMPLSRPSVPLSTPPLPSGRFVLSMGWQIFWGPCGLPMASLLPCLTPQPCEVLHQTLTVLHSRRSQTRKPMVCLSIPWLLSLGSPRFEDNSQNKKGFQDFLLLFILPETVFFS